MGSIRDTIERVTWTVISAATALALAVIADKAGVDLSTFSDEITAVLAVAAVGAVNAAYVWLRRKVGWLPDPGAGLPGAPTGR